jgi:hypothetical protein
LSQISPSFLPFYGQTVEYPWLEFYQVFSYLQPDCGVSLAQISPSFVAFYSQILLYPWLKFHHVFLHFTARLSNILGSNFTKFSSILQPDSAVPLAQISPSFLPFYSQTVEYPWLRFYQIFLHFTAGFCCTLGSNFTKFSCILQLDSAVPLAQI